jgi:hypothetical protein
MTNRYTVGGIVTDLSEEEVSDLPDFDALYGQTQIQSAADANVFGAWSQISADIGTGKRLVYLMVTPDGSNASAAYELEIGEGASTSEAAVTRALSPYFHAATLAIFRLNRALTDNARISVRARDGSGSALYYDISIMVA